MRIALVVHPDRAGAADVASTVAAGAADRDMEVVASEDDAERIPGVLARRPGEPIDADVIVAIGGDGTMLEAVRVGIGEAIPVLGVNAGHVGFLTEIEPVRVDAALDALADGDYTVSERMMLSADVEGGGTVHGLNDAVVEKVVSQHVVKVGLHVGPERMIGYRADAVVVATPTGSTAYTFSAGGPLVDPSLDALVVTAVAPHTLFSRPIVLRPGAVLRLVVEDDRPARLNIDGRAVSVLDPGRSVTVTRSDACARFVRVNPERHFTAAVRDKFHLHDG
ncbi:MAG: NAD(+)/NADH kinase [Acidimicrobiia bacterium]|nr:NAD(+)/NADH kinase [Acidimicrobiia bacterium]